MISFEDLTLLRQIDVHCEKCIRFCVYADAVGASDVSMWSSFGNSFAESAVLHWCRVFGSLREQTHFTRFFEGRSIPMPDGSRLTMERVRTRLCEAAGMTGDEYARFWENVKKDRDKHLVHTDVKRPAPVTFPDLNVLKGVALEMRDMIRDVVLCEEAGDAGKQRKSRGLVLLNGNKKYLRELEADRVRLKRMMDADTEASAPGRKG